MRVSALLLTIFAGALLAQGPVSLSRAPVLVELFTSEGCSSCPPADQLLRQLDARAVVLSEHVDYWDRQGWRDPFSLHSNTNRQQGYGERFRLESVYTPQMVVDGVAEFSGGDAQRAAAEIAKAAQRKKADVRVVRTDGGVRVDVSDSPASVGIFLAVADNSDASQVGGGENNGRHLEHVAVLRSLRKIGSVKRGAGFSQVVALPAKPPGQRTIVFLQEGEAGPVWGAAETGASRQSAETAR